MRRLLLLPLVLLLLLPGTVQAASTPYISQDTRHNVIQIIIAITIIVGIALMAWINRYRNRQQAFWFISAAFTFLCLIGVGVIWYTIMQRDPDEGRTNQQLLLSQADVDPYIEARQAAAAANNGRLIVVPTGVFVQSMEFDSANDVKVTGYVWQRYPLDLPEDFTYGIVTPEGDDVQLEEQYRYTTDDELIIGYHLNTTLRQAFDYRLFPFDRQDVWLRFWAADFYRNVILVPDFASYEPDWNPTELPGLEKDFVLERWLLDRTFYSMRMNTYNASFGIPGYQINNPTAELYFNVSVKRDILDAFIGHMIPLLIVLLMAFGVQFIITQIPDKMSFHGINTIGIMGYCASLFFIAILAQLNLRSQLNASTVVYFEYFYFVVYFVLLLITVNSIIFVATDAVQFLEYEDNLYPKLLFGPITGALLLFVTVGAFY